MKQIYIAVDGGGTKLDAAAVTKDGEIIKRVRVNGGINRRTNAITAIENTVRTAKAELDCVLDGAETVLCAGYLMHNNEVFEKIFKCPAQELDEGRIGLLAAGITGDGVLILSGTGADAYVIKGGFTAGIVGGYGAFLGDEGSGFAIGKAGINAAIACYERRGTKTNLKDKLTAKYPADSFRKSVYGIYEGGEVPRRVADFCIQCEEAADMGDLVAAEIFKNAACALAGFAVSGYRMFELDKNTPFTFAGGVLLHDIKREKPLIFPTLLKLLSDNGIKNYIVPSREPVFGAIEWIKQKTKAR